MKLSSSLQLLQKLTEMFIQFIPNPSQFIQQNEKLEGKILIKEIVICLSSLMNLIITSMIIPSIKLSINSIIECLKINSNVIISIRMEIIQFLLQQLESLPNYKERVEINQNIQLIIQKRMQLPNEMIVEEISGVLTRRTIDWVETLFNVLKESLESIVKINPSFSEMLLTSFQVSKSDRELLPLCYTTSCIGGILPLQTEIQLFSVIVEFLLNISKFRKKCKNNDNRSVISYHTKIW